MPVRFGFDAWRIETGVRARDADSFSIGVDFRVEDFEAVSVGFEARAVGIGSAVEEIEAGAVGIGRGGKEIEGGGVNLEAKRSGGGFPKVEIGRRRIEIGRGKIGCDERRKVGAPLTDDTRRRIVWFLRTCAERAA